VVTIRRTPEFMMWLSSLRDRRAQIKIASRIQRLSNGNSGDVRPVGEGISELRIHYGPGYRVYIAQRGPVLILLLWGGDKYSQDRDIRQAKAIAATFEM
jgi:putative addiction module killer protein